MQLIPHWWETLRRAWSVRFMAIAIALTVLEALLPYLEFWLPIPRGAFAIASAVTIGAAWAARLVAQKNMEEFRK